MREGRERQNYTINQTFNITVKPNITQTKYHSNHIRNKPNINQIKYELDQISMKPNITVRPNNTQTKYHSKPNVTVKLKTQGVWSND